MGQVLVAYSLTIKGQVSGLAVVLTIKEQFLVWLLYHLQFGGWFLAWL